MFLSGLDDARQHECFRFANDVGDCRCVGQSFEREHAARSVGSRHELLADDSAQRFADHDANLLLLIDRENIEQAIERARGIAGVKRAEHEMSRFRRGDGERDRLQIAHFADHDDIGIFTQRAAQRRAERARVRVHFALRDVATFRLEDVFDRIFQRDDVFATFDVYLFDERSERRRFAAADRTGDENEAVVITREQFEMFGQTELVHRAHVAC